MAERNFAMPTFDSAAKMLHRTTEYLALQVASPSASAPEWTHLEWAVARAAAAMQGISMLLANRLRWLGPPIWQRFLKEQRKQSVLRDFRIGELLRSLDTAFKDACISALALKGSALRALDIYQPGERPMGDIDLLVRCDDFDAVVKALDTIGYEEAFSTRRHAVFRSRQAAAPKGFGEHAENPIHIEIHTTINEALPVRQLDITGCLEWPQQQHGLNSYPGHAELMLHLLLHCSGNMRSNALRQIQLYDVAMLARRLVEDDWETLLQGPGGHERRWWIYPPLSIAERYHGGSIPQAVLMEARSMCPLPLRFMIDRKDLTAVSWSNLRIHAFPGIAWSQTPLEAMRYVRSRLVPSRAALSDLNVARKNRPAFDKIPWYGLNHVERIVRWTFSRPPRVHTMLSLRAALGTDEMRS